VTESEAVDWYVVGIEPEGFERIEVFGPFNSETDARAFAMDLADDNGWENVEARLLTLEAASELATEKILWPYKKEE